MKNRNHVGSTPNNPSIKKRTSQKRVVRDSSKEKINRVETYPLYLPFNLDLDGLLNQYPIHVPNARDKLVYLLHQIHAVPAFNGEDEEALNGYTILHSPYLESLVDEYAELVRWLIAHDVIEVDRGYIPGLKSMGYRFTPKYCTRVEAINITLWTLIRRIIRGKKYDEKKAILFPENLFNVTTAELEHADIGYAKLAKSRLSYLTKWLVDDKLKFDIDRAIQYLEERMEKSFALGNDKFPWRTYTISRILIESFVFRSDKISVDDTAGRFHSVLTRLNSPLRALLDWDGKSLSAADIKNSQPVLSLTLLDERLYHKNRMQERISMYSVKYNSDYFIMLGDLIKRNSNKPDTLLFKNKVLSGEIYLWFGKELQEMGIIERKFDDVELKFIAKKELLKSLFNRNQAIGREVVQWAFRKLFPSVYEVFEFVKRSNHKALACVLQNLEAEIVLHKACFELALKYPDLLLLTIHDSIATTTENIRLVYEVLSKHLAEALEHPVKLEIENWDEEYFENKKFKSKMNVEYIRSSSNKKMNATVSYGYYNPDILFSHIYPNLRIVAKELGLKHKNFYESLRQLNIIDEFNHPAKEFEEADLFIKKEHSIRLKFGKSLELVSVKVTDKGFDFLKQLANENPDMFPLRKIKKSRK